MLKDLGWSRWSYQLTLYRRVWGRLRLKVRSYCLNWPQGGKRRDGEWRGCECLLWQEFGILGIWETILEIVMTEGVSEDKNIIWWWWLWGDWKALHRIEQCAVHHWREHEGIIQYSPKTQSFEQDDNSDKDDDRKPSLSTTTKGPLTSYFFHTRYS